MVGTAAGPGADLSAPLSRPGFVALLTRKNVILESNRDEAQAICNSKCILLREYAFVFLL